MSKWVEIKVSIGRINVEALINLVKDILDLEKQPEKHRIKVFLRVDPFITITENGQGGLMGERGSFKIKKSPMTISGFFSADTKLDYFAAIALS